MTRKQIAIAEQKLALQTQTLERAREFVKNKSTVNKDMSLAQGYYVDGNGQPLISATTGGVIPTPVEPPKDPIYDEKTGQLISFSLDENGKMIADVQQVIDMPTFGASTLKNMANAVANGTMTVGQALEVLPPASQQAFLDQIGNIQPKTSTEAQKTVTVEGPDGSKNVMQWNSQTGRYDIPVGTNYQTNSGVPIQDAIAVALSKCSSGAQCGKFVNDVLEAAGAPRLVKDSFESKIQAIKTIGEATSMEQVGAGSIFAYPVKDSKHGHIGIVTSVNQDSTINIMDYNYSGDEKQRERLNVNPNEIINSGGSLSLPIIREDTVSSTQQKQPTQDLMAEAMGLTIGIGGTEGERKQIMKNIVDKATKDGITLQEAKKELKYRTPDDLDFSKNMNEQYDGIRKASGTMTQVKSAIQALKDPNASTDLIGIVGLLKSIDPGSVARSDEVSNVENARSLLDSFAVKWEKLKSGKKLSQEQREQLIKAMQTQVDSYQNRETEFAKEVIGEYETRGLNPSNLFTKSVIDRAKGTQDTTQMPTTKVTEKAKSITAKYGY